MKSFRKNRGWLAAALLLVAGSSQAQNLSNISDIKPLPMLQQQQGKQGLPLTIEGTHYSLLTSASEGLNLVNAQGEVLARFPGNFEVLSYRQHGRQHLIATVDIETDTTRILSVDANAPEISLLKDLPGGAAQTETLCWFQDPQQNLSLFSVDTLGHIEQFMLTGDTTDALSVRSVRKFVGVPQATACTVDDAAQSLYIAEEKVGVWRYSADHEAEMERELVMGAHPAGQIQGEIKGLAVLSDGKLLISAPEQQGVWLVDPQDEQPSFFALSPMQAPEAIGGEYGQQGAVLLAYDDATDQYWQATLPLKPAARTILSEAFHQLKPVAQTTPVEKFGDAADDPAIWVNASEPEKSLILGTDKKQGLMAYDLTGKKVQQLNVGRVNNVDVRYDLIFNGNIIDIASASNRTSNSISLFGINKTSGQLTHLKDIATDLDDVYGLCMAKLEQQYHVFINGTDGRFQQYQLQLEGNRINAQKVREFKVASQPEGCVVDDATATLYFGEEGAGVWTVSAAPTKAMPRMIAALSEQFVADVEGMGIYHMNSQRYLVASSQGNNSYGVFALDDNNKYLGSFQIGMDLHAGIDGVSETDGLEVLSLPLGDAFPHGLMVAQDGRNNLPLAPQNFKLVSGSAIRDFILSRH